MGNQYWISMAHTGCRRVSDGVQLSCTSCKLRRSLPSWLSRDAGNDCSTMANSFSWPSSTHCFIGCKKMTGYPTTQQPTSGKRTAEETSMRDVAWRSSATCWLNFDVEQCRILFMPDLKYTANGNIFSTSKQKKSMNLAFIKVFPAETLGGEMSSQEVSSLGLP